jgi:hypothetical protein
VSNEPVRSLEELEHATARRIGFQIRWELRRLLAEHDGMTQENLSIDHLGYEGSTSASKWFNGKAPLPERAARALDAKFGETRLSVSWAALVRAQKAAADRDGPDEERSADVYDVFLASPMVAAVNSGTYEAEKKSAVDVKETLEAFLKMTVYYAGGNMRNEDDFDVPDIAAEMNFDALRQSRYLVLLATERQEHPRASSIWVEVGYALALRLPCLLLVKDIDMLPYVLEGLPQASTSLLAPVLLHRTSTTERADAILKRQGTKIFQRLDELRSRDSHRAGARGTRR